MHCEPWSPGRPVVLYQQAEGAAEHTTQRLCGGGRAGVGHRHGGSRDAGTVRCTMRYAMCFACWYGVVWCGVVWCVVWCAQLPNDYCLLDVEFCNCPFDVFSSLLHVILIKV